jgi:hypothetical protein
MQNVRLLCDQAKITDITPYYVSRTYLTRHGAGPLPGEQRDMKFEDETNADHPYQGKLRFAPLDEGLYRRISKDADENLPKTKIVFTHCDQVPPPLGGADRYFGGPTRNDAR